MNNISINKTKNPILMHDASTALFATLFSMLFAALVAVALLLGADIAAAKSTTTPTPVGVNNAHLKWEKQFGTGYANAVTPPLIIGSNMYIGSGGIMYKLDANTGNILDKCQLEGVFGYTTIAPSHNGSREDGADATAIYVPISGGRVGAVDISGSNMKPLSSWNNGGSTGASEPFGDQAISPVVYHNGFLYTGSYGDNNSFAEIDAKTGKLTNADGFTGPGKLMGNDSSNASTKSGTTGLASNDNGGYYWIGAYVTDDFAVFGEEAAAGKALADSGKSTVTSVAVSGNSLGKSAGTALAGIKVEGTVRGSMVCHRENGKDFLYFVTQAKKMYKLEIKKDGTFGQLYSVNLSGASVGVPQVTDDRAYAGTSASKVDVIDIDATGSKGSLSLKYSVSVAGYPQGELLVRAKDAQTDYIYGTYNKKPGGIFFIEAGASNALLAGALYDPAHSQYCISPVECDGSGTLFFKNDSGYIMAVAEGAQTSDASSSAQGKTNVKGKNKLAKPKIKTKAGKKKITITWKYIKGASGYKIYQSTKKKGKYKCVKTIKKPRTTKYVKKKLKRKKKYYYKVRAFKKSNGKTVYSAFSNISYKKVK